jgi:Xaa-Pro dipeptidase
VTARFQAKGADALVVTIPENVNYLSGFDTPGYYYPEYLVLVPNQLPTIVVRQFEARNVDAYCWFDISRRVVYQDSDRPTEVLCRVLADLGLAGKMIGLELGSWYLTVEQHAAILRGLKADFVNLSGVVEAERAVKSPAEIEYIRQACRMSEAGIRAALEACAKAPVSEGVVAGAIYAAMYAMGGEYAGLPVFFASGHRSIIPHGRWSRKTLERGETAICELTGVARRYAGPLFRTISIGTPSADIQRRARIVREMLEAAIEAIRPGTTSHEVNAAVVKAGKAAGGGITKRAGYSIGLNYPPDWGEGAFLDLKDGDQTLLRPGMTFHIPQSIRVGDAPTVAISETVLVTDTGREVLTNMPRDLLTV